MRGGVTPGSIDVHVWYADGCRGQADRQPRDPSATRAAASGSESDVYASVADLRAEGVMATEASDERLTAEALLHESTALIDRVAGCAGAEPHNADTR